VLEETIRRDLLDRWGPLLRGAALVQALGYPSAAAFRNSAGRGSVPVTLFRIPGRRGHHALTWEVARWLSKHGDASGESVGERAPADALDKPAC
jgi:hypothetical protein